MIDALNQIVCRLFIVLKVKLPKALLNELKSPQDEWDGWYGYYVKSASKH